jgi:hypothetical protein
VDKATSRSGAAWLLVPIKAGDTHELKMKKAEIIIFNSTSMALMDPSQPHAAFLNSRTNEIGELAAEHLLSSRKVGLVVEFFDL